jgi:hypothetical protein
MSDQDQNVRDALAGLDQAKRETLTRLIGGSAFIAPVVASFAMQGLAIRPAEAGSSSLHSNSTTISDRRLKRDISRTGTHALGFGIYRFKYLWSDTVYRGVLAQEVLEKAPHAVIVGRGNFLAVDYGALGMVMTREAALAS